MQIFCDTAGGGVEFDNNSCGHVVKSHPPTPLSCLPLTVTGALIEHQSRKPRKSQVRFPTRRVDLHVVDVKGQTSGAKVLGQVRSYF